MKKYIFVLLTIAIAGIFFLNGCKEEEENYPTVTTAVISSITDSTAISGGRVISDGGNEVTERGVLWSIEGILFIGWSSQSFDGTGTGIFTSHLDNLEPSTTYYFQAYATNKIGTAYGEMLSFTTLP